MKETHTNKVRNHWFADYRMETKIRLENLGISNVEIVDVPTFYNPIMELVSVRSHRLGKRIDYSRFGILYECKDYIKSFADKCQTLYLFAPSDHESIIIQHEVMSNEDSGLVDVLLFLRVYQFNKK